MARILTLALGFCLVLCLGVLQVEAQSNRGSVPFVWPVWTYPNPHDLNAEQQQMCGRQNVSSVCDPNGLIRPQEADQLDALITDVYRNTTCQCMDCRRNNHGYIIRVAIMPRMERIYGYRDNSSRARLRDAMMYSYILTTRWHMDGACNETLLILYSKHDDILFTLTRQATRVRLTDSDVTRISSAVKHYFEDESTIAEGLMEMIRRYRLVFKGRLSEAFQPSSRSANRRRQG